MLFSCDSTAKITMININKRIQVKEITVINSSLQKGTFAGFLLLRIMLVQRGFPSDSSGMCVPVEKYLYTKRKTQVVLPVWVYTQSKMWSWRLFLDPRVGIQVPRRISHCLFLLLRVPHTPLLVCSSGDFFSLKVENNSLICQPLLDEWINMFGWSYQNIPFIRVI